MRARQPCDRGDIAQTQSEHGGRGKGGREGRVWRQLTLLR